MIISWSSVINDNWWQWQWCQHDLSLVTNEPPGHCHCQSPEQMSFFFVGSRRCVTNKHEPDSHLPLGGPTGTPTGSERLEKEKRDLDGHLANMGAPNPTLGPWTRGAWSLVKHCSNGVGWCLSCGGPSTQHGHFGETQPDNIRMGRKIWRGPMMSHAHQSHQEHANMKKHVVLMECRCNVQQCKKHIAKHPNQKGRSPVEDRGSPKHGLAFGGQHICNFCSHLCHCFFPPWFTLSRGKALFLLVSSQLAMSLFCHNSQSSIELLHW